MCNQAKRFPTVVLLFCSFLIILCSLKSACLRRAEASERQEQVVVSPLGYEGGGRFTAIAISPRDPRVLFVGSDVAGVFKSTDGGETFHLRGKGLEGFSVADIAIYPDDPGRVLLLTQDGLYGSRDQGESWQKESSVVRYESRMIGSRLMVFSKDVLWVAADRNGVFQVRSEVSPCSIVAAPGLEKIKVNGLARFQELMYAGTERGVFRLVDGRWQACNEGLPADRREVCGIVAHPNGRLYLLERTDGLYFWNGGQKKWEGRGLGAWQLLSDRPRAYKALAVHPQNPDIVFMSTDPEVWPHLLYKSSDAGRSWKRISSFHLDPQAAENFAKDLTGVEKIAFSPAEPQKVFLADWSNVWQSRDEGESWSQLYKGLQNTVVNAIRVHPFDAQKIYLAVADNGLIFSGDGGKSWKRKVTGVLQGHAQALEISRKDPSRMYLLMNIWNRKDRVWVYKSLNGGESWEDIGFPVPAGPLPHLGFVDGLSTNLVLDQASDEVVYVGTNGYGVFKTTDGGKAWQPVNRGITSPFVKGPNAILIDPRNSQVLFASTLQGGVYKTTDGGDNWTPVSTLYPFTFGMAMDPSNPSRLFAARPEKKIIVSEDAGRTWKEIPLPGGNPAGIASYAIAVHPLNPKLVVVGTLAYENAADGVYVSRDGGCAFKKVPLDLPEISVLSVEVARSQDLKFFLGFNGIGAFQCEMAAMTR
ncbi:MAG: hypothetical protein ABSG35_16720 [Syntrophobacteraceae bacterium]